MSSRGLVDPALLPLIDSLAPLDLDLASLPGLRASWAAFYDDQLRRRPDAIDVRESHIPGPPGGPDVRVLAYRPRDADAPVPAVLFIHGGGFMLGAPEGSDARCCGTALALGCTVVSVAYRLAPEAPFPGAVEDAYAALRWLSGQSGALGVDPARIAIMGESAGGGIAAALSLLARDRGGPRAVLQVLIYPMLDDRTGLGEPHPYAGEFVWTAALNRQGWAALLGHPPGGPDVSCYAAPARANDLAGLPAAVIVTGALDLFADENMEYGRRLIRAGVPTELHVYPGAVHGFPMVEHAAVTIAAEQDLLSALRRAFARDQAADQAEASPVSPSAA